MKSKAFLLCCFNLAILLCTQTAAVGRGMPPAAKIAESELNIQLSRSAAQLSAEIPRNHFGGSYIKDKTIYINVVEEYHHQYEKTKIAQNGVEVVYQPVELSLGYLERKMEKLIPYMAQYKICTIDADDVTNTLDLEVIEDTEELRRLVASFIDLKYVRIKVVPSYPTTT